MQTWPAIAAHGAEVGDTARWEQQASDLSEIRPRPSELTPGRHLDLDPGHVGEPREAMHVNSRRRFPDSTSSKSAKPVAMKRRVVRVLQKYVVNPPAKAALTLGILPSTHALLETIGRTTGKPRRNPVGNGLAGDGRTFWVVAEHGRDAGYVKNILANPRIRLKIGRRWRTGRAQILPDDDPHARLKTIGRPVNAVVVRGMGTNLLTIRIDLDQ